VSAGTRLKAPTPSWLQRFARKGPGRSNQAPSVRPHGWTDWYRFARDELGYSHPERVEYANLRYVEEQNRASLRRRAAAGS
jgi:hypothetical protein